MGADASSSDIKRSSPDDWAAPAKTRPLRPKDAATLVLVDDQGPVPRVLMGRRRADLKFLPNKFVFPGGRVDRADRHVASADELAETEADLLLRDMKGNASPLRARGIALAALREAFEEAGIVLGRPIDGGSFPPRVPQTGVWADFFATGIVPRLGCLSLLARAITPPGRARRYDTRFFMASASSIAVRTDKIDDELSGLEWFTFEEARALDLPSITRWVIDDLARRMARSTAGGLTAEVPFYFFRNGAFRRILL